MSDPAAGISAEASLKSLDLSIVNLDKEIKQMQKQLKSKIDERDFLIKDRQRMAKLLVESSAEKKQSESSDESSIHVSNLNTYTSMKILIEYRQRMAKLLVEASAEKKQSESSDESSIHVSNLNTYTSKKTLIEYFGQFGAVFIVDMKTIGVKNSGDAYVSFSNITDNESLWNFEHFVDGSLLKVQRFKANTEPDKEHQPKQETKFDERTRSVMVSGYLSGLTGKELQDHFRQFGEIKKYSDTSNKSKKRNDGYRFIFIKFLNYEDADKAAAKSQQTVKTFNLTVKKAKDL